MMIILSYLSVCGMGFVIGYLVGLTRGIWITEKRMKIRFGVAGDKTASEVVAGMK